MGRGNGSEVVRDGATLRSRPSAQKGPFLLVEPDAPDGGLVARTPTHVPPSQRLPGPEGAPHGLPARLRRGARRHGSSEIDTDTAPQSLYVSRIVGIVESFLA